MTYKDLKSRGYSLVKSSLFKGYVSRRKKEDDLNPEPYFGKYGIGYLVRKPNRRSTYYSIVEYWTK